MNRKIKALAISTILAMTTSSKAGEVRLHIVETTDVHGNFFPYDFIKRQPGEGSMARVCTFVDSLRSVVGKENVVLLDCGDILQGQPSAYYYNFIDTASTHLAADIYSQLGYDMAAIGNHDIETGHAVYDRFISQSPVPVLGANIISTADGEPYLPPYKVIERNGVKIAILGLLTPAIPAWLPENLWSGLRFDDMAQSARFWVDKIRHEEKPDLMIGLFHSGRDYSRTTDGMMENASLWIGENIPGFDIIFFGHDHQIYCAEAANSDGTTLMLNPANNARNVALAEVVFDTDTAGRHFLKSKKGSIIPVNSLEPSRRFMSAFDGRRADIDRFVERIIGESTDTMSTRDAYFGPSTFMQLVHELQLAISDAEISFAAPLSFDAEIRKGPLRVSDMFTLYKYENMLYTMRLTGREIKDYLEMAYSIWTRQIDPQCPECHLLNFAAESPSPKNNRLKNPAYNFDSAFGIDYTVDITRPQGEKITIERLSDGRPFSLDSTYLVAVNSYRGNGGGDLLTVGAGIPRHQLNSRIVKATDHDLRYYLMQEVERRRTIRPRLTPNWRFIPEQTAADAALRDRQILFGADAAKEQK